MKRAWLAIVVLAAVVLGGVLLVASRQDVDSQTDKLQLAASYYPLYEFASRVGGDRIQATTMTPSGVEPHDYEPSARSLARLLGADVFVYNGGSFEPWVPGFLHDYTHTAVKAGQGIGVTRQDPHFWLDPILAQQMVVNIRDGLIRADPASAEYYSKQAAQYNAKLAQIDVDFKNGLASCQQHTIVTSHDAFGYVGRRYGFTIEPIAGISPEQEPSPGRLAALAELVQKKGIRYVFFESLVSPRLADTIAKETGAKTLVLDPLEGISDKDQAQGKDYISVQRENLARLRQALACD